MRDGLGYVSPYDPNLGYRVREPLFICNGGPAADVVRAGTGDVFKGLLKPSAKVFGKRAKEGTKTLAKKALDTVASETGSYIGKKSSEKIIQSLQKLNKNKKKPSVTFAAPESVDLSPTVKSGIISSPINEHEIRQRVNRLLSGRRLKKQ